MKEIILYLCTAPFVIGFILLIGAGVASCFMTNKKEVKSYL